MSIDAKKLGADRVVGAVVSSLGFSVVMGAVSMPTFEERSISQWTIPGIFPAFVGSTLLILGLMLTLRATRINREESSSLKSQWVELVKVLGLGLSYVALISKVPFIPLTIAYLAVFLILFNPPLIKKNNRLISVLFLAFFVVSIGLGLPMLFEKVFLVTLP